MTLLVVMKQDEPFRNVALKTQKQESSPETIVSVFCQQNRLWYICIYKRRQQLEIFYAFHLLDFFIIKYSKHWQSAVELLECTWRLHSHINWVLLCNPTHHFQGNENVTIFGELLVKSTVSSINLSIPVKDICTFFIFPC